MPAPAAEIAFAALEVSSVKGGEAIVALQPVQAAQQHFPFQSRAKEASHDQIGRRAVGIGLVQPEDEDHLRA
jgi:hypothetical protein